MDRGVRVGEVPRVWPRGLRDTAAALVWQSLKVSGVRDAVVHHWRLRKVERIRKRAKSATDSEDAAALVAVLGEWHGWRGLGD